MRGWLFIKSITPDILPISIDRGFSSFSPRIFFFFFLPSFSFRGFLSFGDLVLRTRDGVRFPRGWSFFSFGRKREILIVNWMIWFELVAQESRSRIESRRGFSKEISEETGCCSSVGDENGSVFLFASNDHPKIAAATRTHAPFPLGAP